LHLCFFNSFEYLAEGRLLDRAARSILQHSSNYVFGLNYITYLILNGGC
jgi:hypothetical protein